MSGAYIVDEIGRMSAGGHLMDVEDAGVGAGPGGGDGGRE